MLIGININRNQTLGWNSDTRNEPLFDDVLKEIEFMRTKQSVLDSNNYINESTKLDRLSSQGKPMKRSWVHLEPHEWRATDFPGGNNEYFQKLSGRGPWELSLSQYIDAFMMYHKPDWVGYGSTSIT